ncbi:diaminopimelate decarboxylase [Sporosarcina sp. BI001-red]|uniref:diaminopimelate decarboxylase n=1 Tax=Sporosarcina sp. BI001-red TaxID=2282866 RepID=UPI000E23CA4B|nr:diaminopimelate decarboxylase [Sporosarcina sp. BI001-red]REB08728.1 diaminopimelate decarboxylase [Sporosarcina sp. BI001-red]
MEILQIERKSVKMKMLERRYGDFFFIYNADQLEENYNEMFSAFKSRYDRFIIGYSFKTNYLPALVKKMSEMGAYAEVVSRMEFELAEKLCIDTSKIIFNGPLKSYEDIAKALEGNSILNLDSSYEIELVKEYAKKNKDKHYKVGIRVNFDLTIEGETTLLDGYERSRFGFFVENGDAEKAINELTSIQNVDVVGLHGHFSTSIRSLPVYQKNIQVLCDLAKQYVKETLEYLDVGGGFYGRVPKTMEIPDAPTFDDYAETICTVINREKVHFKKEPYLIIEPGLALVADTFKFYCKVIDVKQFKDESFVLVKGSVQNIKPAMHSRNLPLNHVKRNEKAYKKGKFNVVGYTCMEKDYLVTDQVGEIPKPQDYLVFSNVGAYTIVLAPAFIKERPAIIEKKGDSYSVVRKRETLTDFINDNVYVY